MEYLPVTAIAALLAILGIATVLAGAAADRARGRVRCPGGRRCWPIEVLVLFVPFLRDRGCWYDLSGSMGSGPSRGGGGQPCALTCPECGRTWRRWRDLERPRPRLGVVWLGRGILALALAVYLGAILFAPKWYDVAPTWVLCLAVKDGPDQVRLGVAEELGHRAGSRMLFSWQRRFVARRVAPVLHRPLTPAEESVVPGMLLHFEQDARPAVPGINAALAQPNSGQTNRLLLFILHRLGGTETVPGLLNALRSDRPSISGHAALDLGRLREASAVPLLTSMLGRANAGLQPRIISRPAGSPSVDAVTVALGMLGPAATPSLDDLHALASRQSDGRALVTRAAISAIEGREPSMAAALGVAARTPADREDRWALECLAYMERDAAPALPHLIDLVANGDETTRFRTLSAISCLGPHGEPARRAIERLLDEPNLDLVALARRVLNAMGPERAEGK